MFALYYTSDHEITMCDVQQLPTRAKLVFQSGLYAIACAVASLLQRNLWHIMTHSLYAIPLYNGAHLTSMCDSGSL